MKNGLVFLMLIMQTLLCVADQEIANALEKIANDILMNENYENAATNVVKLEQLLKTKGIEKRINLNEYFNPPYRILGLHDLFFALSIGHKDDYTPIEKQTLTKLITFFATQGNPDFGFISPNQKLNIYHNIAVNGQQWLFDLFLTHDPDIKIRLNQEDKSGETPLTSALQAGNYGMAKRFIQAGAIVRQKDIDLFINKTDADSKITLQILQDAFNKQQPKEPIPPQEKPVDQQLVEKVEELVKKTQSKASLAEIQNAIQEILNLKLNQKQLATQGLNWSKALFYLVARPKQEKLIASDKDLLYRLITALFNFGGFTLVYGANNYNIAHASIISIPEIAELVLQKLSSTGLLESTLAAKTEKEKYTPLMLAIKLNKLNHVKLFLQYSTAPLITDDLVQLAPEDSATQRYLIEQKKEKVPSKEHLQRLINSLDNLLIKLVELRSTL